jgi:hypothetical protein
MDGILDGSESILSGFTSGMIICVFLVIPC